MMLYSFPTSIRVHKHNDFFKIITVGKRIHTNSFKFFILNNKFTYARMGLIVSKKVSKRASRRNYIKRVLREWFRVQQCMENVDIVIKVLRLFDHNDYYNIMLELDYFLRLLK